MDGYISYILNNAQRVLTQVDRDKDSLTYGSCDRNYWHLKIRDFSSAILQQTMLTMALLYKVDFEGNIYYGNLNMREWSIAALKYLKKIQLKDGSFNEYYPHEHGYPPTVFVLVSACLTYQMLDLEDETILDCLKLTGKYLSNHTEEKAYNQEFAAITGLYLLYQITQEEWIKDSYDKKLVEILKKQSSDGWFMEQGGADIGYSSVALDMLAEYYWYSNDERVAEPLKRMIEFLQYFIHPDKTIGGEYASRNTTYFMPNGFQVMELKGDSVAQAINKFIFEEIDVYTHFMNSVDERYLSHYVLHSFLRALQKKKENPEVRDAGYQLPCFCEHQKYFSDSGLLTYHNGEYFAICSEKKGGIIKVYHDSKEVFADFGYRYHKKAGTCAATNWLDAGYECTFSGNKLMVKGKFNLVGQKVQNPIYHLGLRVTSLLFGKKINTLAKKILLFSDKHEEIYFEREVIFEKNNVFIKDNIENKTGNQIQIEEASNFSLRLVASGKFFSTTDLITTNLNDYIVDKTLKLEKQFDIDTKRVVCKEVR